MDIVNYIAEYINESVYYIENDSKQSIVYDKSDV